MQEISFDSKHQKFLIGDICLSGYTRTGSVLVNLTDYNNKFVDEGIQSLYDLVIAGNWTIEEKFDKPRANAQYMERNQKIHKALLLSHNNLIS